MLDDSFASENSLSVLIIEDEDSLQRALCLNLERCNYSCTAVSLAKEALKIIAEGKYDLILCDYRLPDLDGISFISECRKLDPDASIILMTGHGNHQLAIEALRAGAYDYLPKPFEIDELLLTLKKIEEREKLKAQNRELISVIEEKFSFENIVAQSQAMKDIFETVRRLAKFNTTVMIRGESGTGKELIARAIHHNSPRKGKPFIAINCGAIPENLMESELFGHKAGSFTDAKRDKKGLFEEANGGTIFLDEIGEMPLHLQVKLLRVLQEHQIHRVGDERPTDIDVRIIAATLRDLEEDVETGRFRDDLYYRLDVVSIKIPALRERPEDIPLLVDHFINKHKNRLGVQAKGVTPEAMRYLIQYKWKGNVRELENCIERGLVLTEGDQINIQSLPEIIKSDLPEESDGIEIRDESNLSIKQHTKALERKLIEKALKKTNGNRTHAAKLLEISHRALLYKLKDYGCENIGKSEQEV